MVLDAAIGILLCRMLSRASLKAIAAWLLFPPFAPPVAAISGPAFLFLEQPRLGRLCASMTAFSSLNLAASALYARPWIAGLFLSATFKLGVYRCAHSHARGLQIAQDRARAAGYGAFGQSDAAKNAAAAAQPLQEAEDTSSSVDDVDSDGESIAEACAPFEPYSPSKERSAAGHAHKPWGNMNSVGGAGSTTGDIAMTSLRSLSSHSRCEGLRAGIHRTHSPESFGGRSPF